MEDKKILSDEELGNVAGGAGTSSTVLLHSVCEGNVIIENRGSSSEEIIMKCQKCGKIWHQHTMENLQRFSDISTITDKVQ